MTSRSAVLLIIFSLMTWCFSLPVQEDSGQCENHLRIDADSSGWQAALTVRTQEDYSGVWIEMGFDRKLDSFSSTYGNVSRLNETSFSILNVNGQVLQKVPFDVTFLMTSDACTDPPLLKSLIINGKTLCLNTEIREKQTTTPINKTNEINVDSKLKDAILIGTTNNAKDIEDNKTKNNTIESDKIFIKNATTNTILPEIIDKTITHKTDHKDTPNSDYTPQRDTLNKTLTRGQVVNNNKSDAIETVNKEFKIIINTSKLNTDKINLLNVTAKEDSANKVASENSGINKSKIELRKLDESIMEKLLETKVDTDVLRELADVESYYSVRNLEKALFKHHVYEKMSTSPDYVKMMN